VSIDDVIVLTIASNVAILSKDIAMMDHLRKQVVLSKSGTTIANISQCTVTYSITIPDIYQAGYSSPSEAYTVATGALNTSISTGSFTSVMNSNAVLTEGSSLIDTVNLFYLYSDYHW
jgi:hypothetical protein